MQNELKRGKDRISMRDKDGLDQEERVEMVRNNKMLDIFFKEKPTYLLMDWMWDMKEREETRIKILCEESHNQVYTLQHSF